MSPNQKDMSLSLSALCLVGYMLSNEAYADSVNVGNATAGATPFLAKITALSNNGNLQSASFSIQPKPGSFTRPITATYSQSYLFAQGLLGQSDTSFRVNIPIFGLYSGTNNIINVTLVDTDGSTVSVAVPFTTASYTDPCGDVNSPKLMQYRKSTSDLQYDYFLLKDLCSTNSPAILDTDGNFRWVGTANVSTPASIFFNGNNGIYASDGKTGLNRIDLTTGAVAKIADYANQNVTFTGHHNIDYGRNGLMLIDVNTPAETEAAAIEVDGTGKLTNQWDFGNIIKSAMIAGGDDPSQFVYPVGNDWFHNNSNTYNPTDNTLIVSSRENFVMAVDYDFPKDGSVKKIHWILGDTTKKWYTDFPSLRKFALNLGSDTLPPIGQHGIALDGQGNLELLNDGYNSIFQKPSEGNSYNYTAADTYKIDLSTASSSSPGTATTIYSYLPSPAIYNPFCGSSYVFNFSTTRLVDFATAGNGAATELQGLGSTNNVVFDLQYPTSSSNQCGPGWNAVPLNLSNLSF